MTAALPPHIMTVFERAHEANSSTSKLFSTIIDKVIEGEKKKHDEKKKNKKPSSTLKQKKELRRKELELKRNEEAMKKLRARRQAKKLRVREEFSRVWKEVGQPSVQERQPSSCQPVLESQLKDGKQLFTPKVQMILMWLMALVVLVICSFILYMVLH